MTTYERRGRLILVAVSVLILFGGLSVRLAALHLGGDDAELERLEKTRRLESQLRFSRGRVLDCNGDILAMDLTMKELCADPSIVVRSGQIDKASYHLAREFGLDAEDVYAKLNRPASRFVYVLGFGERLREERTRAIAALKLPGVFFHDVSGRYYPLGAEMSHVLGYVNLEGVGSAGIEGRMETYLKGAPGLRVSKRDGKRKELYGHRDLDIQPRDGADIVLTLDQKIQYIVEKELDKVMAETRAKGAWAIVQEVSTGKILAMSSRPTFDPNRFRDADPESKRNRTIANVYEPGSTMKAVTFAAVLNERLVTPETEIECERGYWMYGGRPLRDHHAYGRLSVADGLKKSSNILTAKLALKLGNARLESYMRAFGMGAPLGIEMLGEEAGILHPRRQWSKLSPTRLAIGQGVAVTALQMLGAFCAIANDGVLMRPYVVDSVVDTEGRVLAQFQPEVRGAPIRPETAAVMRELLRRVTDDGGTGRRACVPGFSVAGKTGTAQKAILGGYSTTDYIASFVGFLPAEAPELGIIVVVDEPQGKHTGGAIAGPVFREIGDKVVRYLDIPPPAPAVAAAGDRR